jgi:hypothetical protein
VAIKSDATIMANEAENFGAEWNEVNFMVFVSKAVAGERTSRLIELEGTTGL